MAKKIDYIKIDDMSKGINTFARDTMLKKDETADATNVIPTGKASLMKRPGVALMATSSTASAIDGLGTFYATGVNQLLSMAGGHLYQIQSGTAVQVSAYPATAGTWTANKRTDFCQAGANVYISNGTDEMRYYDGTTVRNRTNGVVAKYMIYYKNCLYAIGNSTYPSRVYRSGLDTYIGDFTYSTANTLAASIYVSNLDGQENGTVFKHQDYLYVCKNRSTYRLSVAADSTATMSYELVDPARGADSHFATDAVENDVYIFNEAGVHSIGYEPNYLDQIRTKILSLRIDPIIKAISKSLLDEVCAMYFNNFYHFSYPSGGATYNDKIVLYDRLRSGWWKYNLGARCFSEFKDANGYTKLYFGSPNSNKIRYFDESLKADEGVSFPTEWKSPKYSVDNYSQSKFFLQALLYFGRKPGRFTISAYVDGNVQTVRNVTLGTTGTAGLGNGKLGTTMIGVEGGSLTIPDTGGSDMVKMQLNKMGRNVQIIVEDDNDDKGWELNSVEIAHTPLNKIYQPNTV